MVMILAVTVSMILLASCKSSPEYIVVYDFPVLEFPAFPKPVGIEYDDEHDRVSMPLEYWLSIVDYKIDMDAVKKIYEEYKK